MHHPRCVVASQTDSRTGGTPCFARLPGVVSGGDGFPTDANGRHWSFSLPESRLEYVLWRVTQFPIADRVVDPSEVLRLMAQVKAIDLQPIVHRDE